MENSPNAKSVSGGEPKPNSHITTDNSNNSDLLENPNSDRSDEQQLQDPVDGSSETTQSSQPTRSSRTPFTNLSQVDADLALARTLQEQERAYMMLRMNNDGSDYGSWEAGSFILDDEDDFNDFHDDTDVDDDEEEYDGTDSGNDEDVFDVHENLNEQEEGNNPSIEFDPAIYSSDEAYARALQDAEDRDMATRMLALAGLHDHDHDDDDDVDDDEDDDTEHEDHGVNSQDGWEEVDPDELSYEELIALGEVVGTESRGLSANAIFSLPSVNYKTGGSQNGSNDSCVICRLDYEDGETLTLLSCKHSYHPECINNWLNINKVCPVCSTEVSTSGNS